MQLNTDNVISPKDFSYCNTLTFTIRNQVGENLQDHVGLGGMTFLVDPPVSIVQQRFQTVPITTNYIVNERGPMTVLGGLEAVAFINTKYANVSDNYPDIQYHFAPASVNSDAGSVALHMKLLLLFCFLCYTSALNSFSQLYILFR